MVMHDDLDKRIRPLGIVDVEISQYLIKKRQDIVSST